jgi:hypothetical protein
MVGAPNHVTYLRVAYTLVADQRISNGGPYWLTASTSTPASTHHARRVASPAHVCFKFNGGFQ